MQNILITGGTGTLGHALVAELYNKTDITIYSRSELNQARMRTRYPKCRYVIGDVRDYNRTLAAIAGHDTVIHAAAMKRIPECEAQPHVCYETNVLGSEVVATACVVSGVETCIGVSTDKACQPVTVYGASKLLMERLFATMPDDCKFVCLRLGNVLESNGSVIPIWKEQAANGEPLTITSKEMTRFWLSPRQAARYTLHALGFHHAEIFVPKLKSLPVTQMASYIANGVKQVETGLRSIERIHEWLVSPDEPAIEDLYHYVIADHGRLEHIFNSANAEQLTKAEFMDIAEGRV